MLTALQPMMCNKPCLHKVLNFQPEKFTETTTELSVRTFGKLNTEDQFNNLVIKNIGGVNVKLSDVADVVLGPENEESGLKESGVPMIMLAIIPQPGANYVSISNEFYKRLAKLKKRFRQI